MLLCCTVRCDAVSTLVFTFVKLERNIVRPRSHFRWLEANGLAESYLIIVTGFNPAFSLAANAESNGVEIERVNNSFEFPI